MAGGEGIVGAIIGLFVAIALIWAFFPVLSQLGAMYGILFLVLGSLIVLGAVVGVLRSLS